MPRHGQPPGSAASAGSSTLADENVHLLWQVAARAEELLTAAAHGRWPGLELAALAGYAQAEVLRQASDEEALLFPAVPSREVAGLARDQRLAASTVTLDENGGVPSIVSSHLEVTARVPGLDLIDSDAEIGETSCLYPVSRLFVAAQTTVSAALKPAS